MIGEYNKGWLGLVFGGGFGQPHKFFFQLFFFFKVQVHFYKTKTKSALKKGHV